MKIKTIMALFAAIAGLCLSAASARAVVLDWDLLTWNAGSLSHTYYATNSASPTGFFYKDDLYSGVASVTITISGDTSFLASGSPAIDSSLQGGLGGSEKSLRFDVDFTSNTQSIIVTVTFNNYVDGVDETHFTLFDVDKSSGSNDKFYDQVRNITADGVQPAEVIGSSKNVVSNNWTTSATATGTGPAGSTSGNGNVDIDFKIYDMTEFSYTFGNSTVAKSNPENQEFAFHDIHFKPKVPEVGPGVVAMAVCGLAIGLRLLRSRKGS